MDQIKIPKLSSNYIPVHGGLGHLSEMHWWKNSSLFKYPFVLANLMQFTKEQMEQMKADGGEDLFLLTDSGGFQVISGTCNLTWETSLKRQIDLGATKIFSFDIPPVKIKKDSGALNAILMNSDETRECITTNVEVAVKQSKYLKEYFPEEFKKFCYVMQVPSKEFFNFNLDELDKHLEGKDYSEMFPGGVVCSCKDNSLLNITIIARMLYEKFIKKGIYVHFLGMGSFSKMIVLIRNKITTFDSSGILQGVRANTIINPLDTNKMIQIKSDSEMLNKPFCNCPVCNRVDYKDLKDKGEVTTIARYFCVHNLWHLVKINMILDAVPLNNYTKFILNEFNVNDTVKKSLEFCDDCDKIGFEMAMSKYKFFLKPDTSKQKGLF